jgi:VanZ family protein
MNDRMQRARRFGPRFRGLVWSVYTVAWTTALLTPHPVRIADALLEEDHAFYASKTLHVSAYAVLSMLSGWLCVPVARRWMLLTFLSAHALGTEYFQRFVPLRYPSWTDVGWDHIGIVLGLILSWGWWIDES